MSLLDPLVYTSVFVGAVLPFRSGDDHAFSR